MTEHVDGDTGAGAGLEGGGDCGGGLVLVRAKAGPHGLPNQP